MKNGIWLAAILTILGVSTLVPVARAQSIWVVTGIDYEGSTVYGQVAAEPDTEAEMYYDITVSGSMWDDQGTVDDGGEPDADDPYAIDFTAQNPPVDDEYYVSGSAIAYLDPAYALCGCPTCFYVEQLRGCSRGCPVCCQGWTDEDLPGRMSSNDPESEDVPNPGPCGPTYGDLDKLVAEYSTYGIVGYTPSCGAYQSKPAALTPSYGFNGGPNGDGLASPGDVTDWAYLDTAIMSGLNALNTNIPSAISSVSGSPLFLTEAFRTPAYNCSNVYGLSPTTCGAHAYSRHEFGDAVDIATFESETNWYNLLSWTESQVGAGACIENSTMISNWDHTHIDWKLIMPPTRSTCGANEFQAVP